MALRTVGVKLAAEVSGYVNRLNAARSATREFAADLDKAARAGKLDEIANQAGGMGLALAAGFGGVVAMTAKFDKQMSEVGAVANATGEDLQHLRDAALAAGEATSFSATEAAKAQAELAKAGLSTADILSGALSGSLALAAAGSLDLAEAADISAKAMNMFKLRGSDVGHIADLLAAAANKSATDVHELGEALKMGGLASNAAGMSLEETVGTLAAFGDRALNGSDAGTSLKTALMMLQAPTEKSANLMAELGIEAYDAAGNFVGTAKLAGNLRSALGGLTQEQRNAALATIFGADAMRAANVLYEVGEDGIREYVRAVNDQGAAADVARAKTDNLAGDIERLTGSLQTLAIESSSGATSGLRTLVQGADNLVSSLSGIPAPAQNAAVLVAGVAGAALLAAAGAAKMRAATALAGAELADLGPRGERAAKGLDKAGRAAGRVGVALVALNVASALGGSSLNVQLEGLASDLEKFSKHGDKAGEVARIFGDDLGKLDTALKDVADTGRWSSFARGYAGMTEGLTGAGNVFDDSLQHSRERLEALDAALAQMVSSGNAEQAKQAFEQIAARAAEQGVSVAELEKVLPAYTVAVGQAGKASADAAAGVAGVGAEAATAAEDVDALKAAFDELFGAQMSADRAAIAYKQGVKDLVDELKDGKRTLDANTQAGRDNRSAMLDQIDTIEDVRQANIDSGMSIEEANGIYDEQLTQLQRTATKLGFNESQVRDLIAAYRAIPKQANTNVTANTGPAMTAARKLREYLKNIPDEVVNIAMRVTGNKSASATAHAIAKQYANRWGNIHHAETGLLSQAGMWGSGDTMYAFREPATGGEAFIPKNGDDNRSRAIWEYVGENWLGARPAQPQYVVAGGGGGGTMRVDITLTWPDGRMAGRIVADGIRSDTRGTLSAIQDALRVTPGVRLKTSP